LRIDLEAAGVPYTIEGPNGPLYADFHALRHSYIALLDRSGATLKEAMQLARHSDPKLTMAVYGRAQLHDLGETVRRLPSLLDGDLPVHEALQATGTGGPNTPPAASVCTEFAQTNATGREDVRLAETPKEGETGNTTGPNPLIPQGVEAGCDSLRLAE